MADLSGGIGQQAGELVKEMQKAQAEMQTTDKAKQDAKPTANFQEAMQSQQQQSQLTKQASDAAAVQGQTGRIQTDSAINKVITDQRTRDKLATTSVGVTEKTEESRLTGMLQNLINGQDKMTKIMNVALSGKQFSPSELLAMQAGVYRFSQELDLTSKVVEKATGGIKQTLNTQV